MKAYCSRLVRLFDIRRLLICLHHPDLVRYPPCFFANFRVGQDEPKTMISFFFFADGRPEADPCRQGPFDGNRLLFAALQGATKLRFYIVEIVGRFFTFKWAHSLYCNLIRAQGKRS